MSMTQTLLGGGIFVAVGTAIIQAVSPAPDPIQIHSLKYNSGIVTQDRTVLSETPFYANWAAAVVDHETGEAVCEGDGAFAYKPGRVEAKMSLSRWVGQPCLLPPGSYHLSASWYWGGNQVGAESGPFEVTE